MKKKWIVYFMLVAVLLVAATGTASADSGPKPSVTVSFQGIAGEPYYATLLSQQDSGPWSSKTDDGWTGEAGGADDKSVEKAFGAYQDTDGYRFIGCYGNCTETNKFIWSYYPPEQFKVLVYLPENKRFLVSGVYESYAFDSYFVADAEQDGTLTLKQDNTPVWSMLFRFLLRVLLTLVIELGIALLFRFRRNKQLLIICGANLLTQIALNIFLYCAFAHQTFIEYLLGYFAAELAAFLIEGLIYRSLLPRFDAEPERKMHPWIYALVANFASWTVGFLLLTGF